MYQLNIILRNALNRNVLRNGFGSRFYLILFSISMLGQYAYAFSLSSDYCNENVKNGIQFTAPDSHQKLANPFDFPLFSEPDTEDSETESGSGNDYELDVLFIRSTNVESYLNGARKSASSSFISLILNRRTVSLIVLHHSWKSDLA